MDQTFHGETHPYRGELSDVRVITMIMRVPVVKSLCQMVMRWVHVLECLLPSMCGCLWLRPVMPDIKWHYFPRTRL
jgi:hypothetical protein